MTGNDERQTIGSIETDTETPQTPLVLTRLVWLLWVGTLGVAVARVSATEPWSLRGLVVVDGLTVLLWTLVTFFGGIVHSYSRRYLAGTPGQSRFFRRVFGFTLVVGVLAAADHAVLFGLAWLAMGLVMADLIGHVRGWPQAQAAGRLARRYFLASTAALAVALGTLWLATGRTTLSGFLAAADGLGTQTLWLAAGALLVAAAVQSALVPFHGWLLGSMTAPTPASALMHAGFVNAGGVLLAQFAPIVTAEPGVALVVVCVGATSALGGKLLKTVQPDVKRQLGCSTVGQMGFMIVQAGLGFFGAAVTHLLLHGFYKAYQFLSAGEAIDHTSPQADQGERRGTGDSERDTRGVGAVGTLVTLTTGVAGGGLFALLTGKGTAVDAGLLLTLLVVVVTLHAAWAFARRPSLSPAARYLAVPVVALPAVVVYAGVYAAVTTLLGDLPVVTAPAELHPVHVAVAGAFLLAYVALETGVYRRSSRLYVALVNAGQPPADTLTTTTEEYDEH
jgi:NAD(P)H-quinone oxidoreductase subunit 5